MHSRKNPDMPILDSDTSASGYLKDSFEGISRDFTDLETISKSGTNVLVRAKRYGRWWMLKGLAPEVAGRAVCRQMLRKEFETLMLLQHPNIVSVQGLEPVDGLGECIVMEFVDGQPLSRVSLTEKQKPRVVDELLSAVAYCHSMGIVHRDLKPSNIMLTRNGGHVKLIDFGLADSDSSATLKQPAGTHKYMSPEQAVTNVADVRNDIYSIGVILDKLNLGRRFRSIIAKCMLPVDARYQSVEELQEAVARKRSHKGNVLLAGMAAAIAVLIGTVVFLLMKTSGLPEKANGKTDGKTGTVLLDTVRDGNISFADQRVKALCLANWDTDDDGELSFREAASVDALEDVFHGNNDIKTFDEFQYFIGLEIVGRSAFNKCKGLEHITLPPQITRIENYAFLSCVKLKEIKFPNHLEVIGEYSFSECSSLEEVSLPNSLIKLGNSAFSDCKGLKRIRFNHSISVPLWCFSGCENVETVDLGDRMDDIGNGSFFECKALKNLVIPPSVKSIGEDAFHNCYSLRKVYVGDSVRTIASAAFWGDDSLRIISLPSVEVLKANDIFFLNIGKEFGNHSSLDTVVIRGGDPGDKVYDDYFSQVKKTCLFLVPPGTASAFRAKGYLNVQEHNGNGL